MMLGIMTISMTLGILRFSIMILGILTFIMTLGITSVAKNLYAECNYAECRYAECHFTKCRGAAEGVASAGTTTIKHSLLR
jgi:hypothetical protein